MSENRVSTSDIISWVERCLEDEEIRNHEIFLTGNSQKSDGYIGDIAFVTAKVTKDGQKKHLHLVVKHSKKNQHLRNNMPMKLVFENEIFFYDTVLPAFKQFQLDRNVQNHLSSTPQCLKTMLLDEMEVLILGNIKKLGFELHNRKETLGVEHLKAVLREYGRLHALSFAMKVQVPEQFDSLVGDRKNVMAEFFSDKNVAEVMNNSVIKALELLEENNDLELLGKYKKFLKKDASEMFFDTLKNKEPQSVITHGDCWNNNFMFKYENGDRTAPSKAVILDWQLSTLHSPVTDLSYLIYSTSSTEELENFEQLLQEYHKSLSDFLKELGSDPEQVFSYSDLKDHWRKYSIHGFIFTPLILKFALCDQEQAPAFEDLQENDKISEFLDFDIPEYDLYYGRLRAVVDHFFNHRL